MSGTPLSFEVVREIAGAWPEVEEGTTYRAPCLRFRGKLLTCLAVHSSAEPHSLVVAVGFDQRAQLAASNPDVYYWTEHYEKYPYVLVRMSRIRRDSLRALLEQARSFVAHESADKAARGS